MADALPAGSVTVFAAMSAEDGNAQKMVEAALGFSGRLDILVNNAAIEMNENVVELDPAVWRQQLEVNLTGPFLMMKAAIPKMIEGGGGSIVNVSSLAGVVAVPGAPAYCTTKAGIIHLTKQVALDYGKHNVRCNVVCPGPIRTSMLEMNFKPLAELLNTDMDGVFDKVRTNVPLHRIGNPPDIAGVFRLPGERRLTLHDRLDRASRRRRPYRRRVRRRCGPSGGRLGLEDRGRIPPAARKSLRDSSGDPFAPPW